MTSEQRERLADLRSVLTEMPPPTSRQDDWRWAFFMVLTVCVTSIVVTGLITHG